MYTSEEKVDYSTIQPEGWLLLTDNCAGEPRYIHHHGRPVVFDTLQEAECWADEFGKDFLTEAMLPCINGWWGEATDPDWDWEQSIYAQDYSIVDGDFIRYSAITIEALSLRKAFLENDDFEDSRKS